MAARGLPGYRSVPFHSDDFLTHLGPLTVQNETARKPKNVTFRSRKSWSYEANRTE